VEETAPLANALLATAEPAKTCKILLVGAENTHGTKHAANVLSHMKAEEMLMLSTTTPTDPLMSDFGKSTPSTGDNAVVEKLPAILKLT
jgi:hypothetical protein